MALVGGKIQIRTIYHLRKIQIRTIYHLRSNDSFCKNLYIQIKDVSVDVICSMNIDELFERFLILPLEQLRIKTQMYIIIDVLDELEDPNTMIRLLKNAIHRLPNNLKLIVSSRNTLNLHFDLRYYDIIDIEDDNSSTDIYAYLNSRLACLFSNEQLAIFEKKCERNFLYARLICDDLLEGKWDLKNLPSNLEYVYHDYFLRAFARTGFTNEFRKAFSIIVASKEAISLDLLSEILQWDNLWLLILQI